MGRHVALCLKPELKSISCVLGVVQEPVVACVVCWLRDERLGFI